MKRISIVAATLLALALSAVAFAQTPQTQGGKRKANRNQGSKKLKKMDTNLDGQISRDEWKGRDRGFQKSDQNNDGIISGQEIASERQSGKRQLKRMDTDKNRQITRSEWSGDSESFNKLDKNNDGVIARKEMKSRKRKG